MYVIFILKDTLKIWAFKKVVFNHSLGFAEKCHSFNMVSKEASFKCHLYYYGFLKCENARRSQC